jgi:hypothetical protein
MKRIQHWLRIRCATRRLDRRLRELSRDHMAYRLRRLVQSV